MGVTFQTSNPYTPEENGAAEKDHQTKMGKVRCALRDANLPAKWWQEARKYMTYVKNCTPMSLGYVCFAYVHQPVRKEKKLYARDTKGYRLLDVYNNKHFVARSVTFDTENCASIITRSSGTEPEQLTADELNDIDSLGRVRRNKSCRNHWESNAQKGGCQLQWELSAHPVGKQLRRTQTLNGQSAIVHKRGWHRQKDHSSQTSERVTKQATKKQWQEALDLEYQSLLENRTWKFTKLPIGYEALPCHWVLAVKYNDDGSIDRFKARLVAQETHQEFGVNCDEVYAPVARFESLRLVLGLETILDCHIHQMDVHTVFLNWSMDEEQNVYMYQPPGTWFYRCNKEYCIYVQNVGKHWIVLVVYVDDLTIMSKDMRLINQLKSDLSSRFKMKDLVDIHYILKMEVRRNREKGTMTISQHSYINEPLKKFKMEGCASVATPQLRGEKIEAETGMSAQQITVQDFDYRGVVGSLQYLARGTRPHIANAYDRNLTRGATSAARLRERDGPDDIDPTLGQDIKTTSQDLACDKTSE
ncbi:Integrase, catalytic core protein [Phytophthora megakarya]|uniref:Integrase, catalytic core protein n=1 Tax=Phytophthora megakarya TaxID=4795 RepID=A0A225V657_9STRA|nr:Integrase, catalytic core protein [Phytophthora megakarya]